jgi:hypothetical protein
MLAHASVGKTLARRTAIVKTLHNVLDGTRERLAAHRECERLILKGMRHDPALRATLSGTSHRWEASVRRTSIQSAFLILMATVGAWIDRWREKKTLAPARRALASR